MSRSINVIDVSPANDWSAVRVALGQTSVFGSVYPTFGFIYDRADRGNVVTASAIPAAPLPSLNPAPSDLRLTLVRATRHAAPNQLLAEGQSVSYAEVAEAPDTLPAARHAHLRVRSR